MMLHCESHDTVISSFMWLRCIRTCVLYRSELPGTDSLTSQAWLRQNTIMSSTCPSLTFSESLCPLPRFPLSLFKWVVFVEASLGATQTVWGVCHVLIFRSPQGGEEPPPPKKNIENNQTYLNTRSSPKSSFSFIKMDSSVMVQNVQQNVCFFACYV